MYGSLSKMVLCKNVWVCTKMYGKRGYGDIILRTLIENVLEIYGAILPYTEMYKPLLKCMGSSIRGYRLGDVDRKPE